MEQLPWGSGVSLWLFIYSLKNNNDNDDILNLTELTEFGESGLLKRMCLLECTIL